MKPLLVVISGAPGSGKTALSRRLAPELKLPLISKDTIKEVLLRPTLYRHSDAHRRYERWLLPAG